MNHAYVRDTKTGVILFHGSSLECSRYIVRKETLTHYPQGQLDIQYELEDNSGCHSNTDIPSRDMEEKAESLTGKIDRLIHLLESIEQKL